MHKRSDTGNNWDTLRDKIIGLGERSVRKSYYPELRARLAELERFRALLDQSNDAIILLDAGDMTVVDLNPIKVEVQVLEAEIRYLSEGRRASVTFAAFPDETFNGRVETINPVVNPDDRTARVTVVLENADGRIKPGMYARVALEAQYYPDRILVPRSDFLE